MLAVLAGGSALAALIYFGLKKFAPWIHDDVKLLQSLMKMTIPALSKDKAGIYLADLFDEAVLKRPDKVFLIFKDQKLTYREVNMKANQVARAVMEMGLVKGDVVAILMYNGPNFVWTYLGLQKLGIKVAFLNYNQKLKVLHHSIMLTEPKCIIIDQGTELMKAMLDIKADIPGIKLYSLEKDKTLLDPSVNSFDKLMSTVSSENIDPSLRKPLNPLDANMYIFTSGTTGLPKPAIVSNRKVLVGAFLTKTLGFAEDDILYETLPLYHSASSVIGVGGTIVSGFYGTGATMVLKEKFSASQFWIDCKKHNVTVIHYIGELLRYLVNKPVSKYDQDHCVKNAFGNGLRRDVWARFQERFNIPNIYEFYAATEYPMGFINVNNKVGMVGRSSPFMRMLQPAYFIKYDVLKDEPVRGPDGFCIPINKEEAGLFITPINPKKNLTFEGYKGNKSLNEKKLLHDVFKKGDVFINSGDLLYVDKDYNVSFHDRIGDTFRWKGENVSTTEVANVVSSLDFIHDTTVYGVSIPGCEGRAGMAGVRLLNTEVKSLSENSLEMIAKQCSDFLPAYAKPRFLRLLQEDDLTSTFKQRKTVLQNEGYQISKIEDPLYYLDVKTNAYKLLDESAFNDINEGSICL